METFFIRQEQLFLLVQTLHSLPNIIVTAYTWLEEDGIWVFLAASALCSIWCSS